MTGTIPSPTSLLTAIVVPGRPAAAAAGDLVESLDALSPGEERLNAVIGAAPVAVLEVDLDTRVRRWNDAAERIYGWTAEEVLGRPVPFVPAEQQAEFEWLLGRVRAGNAYTGFETVRRRKDGSLVDVEIAAAEMIGMRLVTYQTGPAGQVVQRVLVEQGVKIRRELYLGIVIDRSTEKPVLMVSPDGGVEIEKVAAETPERIFKEYIDPGIGLASYQGRKLAFALGLEGNQLANASMHRPTLPCRSSSRPRKSVVCAGAEVAPRSIECADSTVSSIQPSRW